MTAAPGGRYRGSMGRPKGSGQGLVALTIRVTPEVFHELEMLREGEKYSLGEVARSVLAGALLRLTPEDRADAAYDDGLRRGLAKARALIQAAIAEEWR